MIDFDAFRQRRKDFFEKLNGGAAIIPAAPLVKHHADCEYPFRQNSDFWYLTGFDEPNAVALFLSHKAEGERFILFVSPKEPDKEVWFGLREGVEGAMTNFGADVAHSLDDFPKELSNYLKGSENIFFRIGQHPSLEKLVLKVWASQLDQRSRTGSSPHSLIPPCPLIHQMRLKKQPEEIESIRQAVRISAGAHELAREMTSPGMNERQIQALIEQYFLEQGARGPAYNSIVAGGDNACVLHYTSNNAILKNGDLLLIDAGCSMPNYYNGDITRTFPINGKFTSSQRAIYEIVLDAQTTAIDSVTLKYTAEDVHQIALRTLVEGLRDLGLLRGSIDSLLEQNSYRHLYMHKTGHWLGLDVHDVGAYRLGDYHVDLEPGMVLTVEPGVYISDRIPVPEGQPEIDDCWKGIGVRIEDDVLVTDEKPEVLSQNALKTVEEISC